MGACIVDFVDQHFASEHVVGFGFYECAQSQVVSLACVYGVEGEVDVVFEEAVSKVFIRFVFVFIVEQRVTTDEENEARHTEDIRRFSQF